MALGDKAHSRLVAWLKIALPLAALALLSTLFLLARPPAQPGEPPFGQNDIRSGTAEEVITEPVYTGKTVDGTALTIRASEVRPGGAADGPVTAASVEAQVEPPAGGWMRLQAARAAWAQEGSTLVFEGAVELEDSGGYDLRTDRLVVTVDRFTADTEGPVEGRGPAGTIRADRLRIETAEDGGNAQLLFTGGVKLVYEPQG